MRTRPPPYQGSQSALRLASGTGTSIPSNTIGIAFFAVLWLSFPPTQSTARWTELDTDTGAVLARPS